MEPSNPLYARGPYRVLATAPGASDDAPAPAFVVTDTAGTPLRAEPSFDAARAWVDDRVDAATVTAPRRARRR